MKLSEFKQAILDRLWILKANTIYTFHQETASWMNNWISLLSTGLFTVATLIFIHVVYSNVNTIAGYTRNEMFFFFFIGEVGVYLNSALVQQNLRAFGEDVRAGNLDLILTKPIPALFYITFKRIQIISFLRVGLIPIISIAVMIDWSKIQIPLSNLIFGLLIFLMGQIIMYVIQFVAISFVFWFGESRAFINTVGSLYHNPGITIPLEGFDFNWRILFGVVIPVLIVCGFSTSVMLGKSEPLSLLIWAGIVTALAFAIRNLVWHQALRSYTSASS